MSQIREEGSVSLFLSELSPIEKLSSKANKKIELYIHKELGKVLVINDEIQHVEAWASLYHEIIVHLPCLYIKNVKTALILGGGSLYAAREILKYDSVEEVTLVDFDVEVLGLVKRHYLHAQEAIEDKRLKIITKEAFQYVKNCDSKFDLILNDSIDLFNHSKKFVSKNVFKLLASRLTNNGICSDVIYRHIFEKVTTLKTVKYLKGNFNSAFSLITIPEYPGVLHLLTLWGKNKNLSQDNKITHNRIQKVWISNLKTNPCEVYNPSFLPFYLYLPPYLKKVISI